MAKITMLQALAITLASLLVACGENSGNNHPVVGPAPVNPFEGFSSTIYSSGGNWLCHPSLTGEENVCNGNLDATRVFANGSTDIELHTRAIDPKVDCFYVYPTVSEDAGKNSDLEKGPEEVFAALTQAARYSRFCRMFAPVYRQFTFTALAAGPENLESATALAYDDVLDSFKHYMANDNNGRGFFLIGHSQGSIHLKRLIVETVEPDEYLLHHMISAHLIGWPIHTPEGADVGGDFQQVAVCRTSDQTGCVVSYSTYRDTDPQLAAGLAFYGRPEDGAPAICANPAALSGGSAYLDSYFPVEEIPFLGTFVIKRVNGPFADPESVPGITTPFYKMPDFVSGNCVVDANGISYLQASSQADPVDPRADDFNGEFAHLVGWGLHLVDITLAMGDLVNLGTAQAHSWLQDQ